MTVEPGGPADVAFGRFRLLGLIGEGGMGRVYKAHDTVIDRDVAIKVLPIALGEQPGYRERFRREAHTAARLTDPHVIPIYDAGENDDGHLYLVMPVIDGVDVETLLKRDGAMNPPRAVAVIEQLAAALDAAHKQGLVHRDVKPSNALITGDDFVYLIDFGIAHDAAATKLTNTGMMVGTLAYMAPERFTTGTADARADIYALACVLHECLTGTTPFAGNSVEQQIAGHLTLDPPQPSTLNAAVPAGFDEVIATGMAKKPEQRYQSARALAAAARDALTALSTATPYPHTAPTLLDATQPPPAPTALNDQQPPPPQTAPPPGNEQAADFHGAATELRPPAHAAGQPDTQQAQPADRPPPDGGTPPPPPTGHRAVWFVLGGLALLANALLLIWRFARTTKCFDSKGQFCNSETILPVWVPGDAPVVIVVIVIVGVSLAVRWRQSPIRVAIFVIAALIVPVLLMVPGTPLHPGVHVGTSSSPGPSASVVVPSPGPSGSGHSTYYQAGYASGATGYARELMKSGTNSEMACSEANEVAIKSAKDPDYQANDFYQGCTDGHRDHPAGG
jgi:serine/threonine protein kinase